MGRLGAVRLGPSSRRGVDAGERVGPADSDREDADDRPREHGRRQRQRQREAGEDIRIEPAPDEPAGGRVLADLRRDGGGRGAAPPRAKRGAGAAPGGEPGRCRDQYQDDHRHMTSLPAARSGKPCMIVAVQQQTARGDGRARHRGARRRPSALAARAPAHLVADRPRHGRAPRAGLRGGYRHWVRAARGGDAPGRLGAPDVRASRARLRPPRRARERVAGGAPDEPSHRHLLLALRDRRRLCHPGARGGHHPRRGRAPQVAGGGVHPHGHRRRGGDLPRRDARDRSPAPARSPPGRPPGERQLLLRAHGGLGCGLLRDRAPHHVVGAKPRGAGHRVARRGRDPAACRAGADVPGDAPPDRRDRGPPRRHRVPDRRPDRRPGRGSRRTGSGAS